MLGLQPVQGRQVRRAAQLVVRLFGERRVVLGMPAAGVIQATALLESLDRILADRLEHAYSRLAVGAVGRGDQADVEQFGDLLQRIGLGTGRPARQDDRGKRVKVAAAGEHPGPLKVTLQVIR